MSFSIRPATSFADLRTILGPKNPTSSVCWCLSHRLDSATHRALIGPERAAYVEKLTRRAVAPGVLAYDGDEVVGWTVPFGLRPITVPPQSRGTRWTTRA